MHPRHKIIAAGGNKIKPLAVNYIAGGVMPATSGAISEQTITLAPENYKRHFIVILGASRGGGNMTTAGAAKLFDGTSERSGDNIITNTRPDATNNRRLSRAYSFELIPNISNPILRIQNTLVVSKAFFAMWEILDVDDDIEDIETGKQTLSVNNAGVDLETENGGAVFGAQLIRLNGHTSETLDNLNRDLNVAFNGGDGDCVFAAGHALTDGQNTIIGANTVISDSLFIGLTIRQKE